MPSQVVSLYNIRFPIPKSALPKIADDSPRSALRQLLTNKVIRLARASQTKTATPRDRRFVSSVSEPIVPSASPPWPGNRGKHPSLLARVRSSWRLRR